MTEFTVPELIVASLCIGAILIEMFSCGVLLYCIARAPVGPTWWD
jgi:hypothetical protein